MKRSTIMGALASFALVCLSFLAPQAAHAAVTCTQVNTSGGYPNGTYTQWCGSATAADGQSMLNALTPTGLGLNELRTAYESGPPSPTPYTQPGITFYVFGTQTEFESFFPSATKPAAADFGVVQFDASNRPAQVAIFMKNGNNVVNTQVENITANYAGHALDALVGYIANGGVLVTPYVNMSDTTAGGKFQDFNAQFQHDWAAFNLLPACGSGGAFSNQADPRNPGTYMCNGTHGNGTALNPTYSNLCTANPSICNQTILQTIWPNPYKNTTQFFAEGTAYFVLSDGNQSAVPYSTDFYLQPSGAPSQFLCSRAYLQYVFDHEALPLQSNLPTGCPKPGITTAAVKLFSGSADPANPPCL